MIVYAVFNTAQRRFRRHSVLKQSDLAKLLEIVSSELDYLCASDTLRCPGKYHQHDDIFKAMTDIAPGCPTEIRNRRGKIHQSVEDAALGFNFILYFCSVIVRRCDSQTILVSGLNFFITN